MNIIKKISKYFKSMTPGDPNITFAFHMRRPQGQGGFTLIEMLIVIAVIATLAGVVLTGVTGFMSAARDTRRVADLKNAQNFLELYFVKCGHYPGGISGGVCNSSDPANWDALADMMEREGFTSNFPQDPVAGRTYFYGSDADNLSYTLGASLERDNRVLMDDLDGTQDGVNCADSPNLHYCIGS